MKTKGFTVFELLIVAMLISVFAYFGFNYYSNMMTDSKKTTLEQELKSIRRVLEIYRQKRDKYPEKLIELQQLELISFEGKDEKDFSFGKEKVTENGEVLDPFGNPYYYENGEVRSVTGGYEEY